MSPSWFTIRQRASLCTALPLFLLAFMCLIAPLHAIAAQPERLILRAFSVATEGETMVLRVAVDIDDREALRNLLRDGAQLKLTLAATLKRSRTLMPAEEVGVVVAEILMRHDPLTREFEFSTSPDLPHRRDRNFNRLMDATLERLRLPLAPAAGLAQGESYTLSLTCGLRHTQVPPWLEKTLFFWSWDVVPESTYTQSFTF